MSLFVGAIIIAAQVFMLYVLNVLTVQTYNIKGSVGLRMFMRAGSGIMVIAIISEIAVMIFSS